MSANSISITPDELVQLEVLCDRTSLYDVLCALAAICHEKAEHIDQSYSLSTHGSRRDGESNKWRKRALQLQSTAEYLERMESQALDGQSNAALQKHVDSIKRRMQR
jgi:hypothetical protein